MTVATPKFGMGASVLRLEDAAFITGRGRYTDDIAPERLLHGYVLRSPVASAAFRIASTEAARAAPGRAPRADRRRSRPPEGPRLGGHAEAARRQPRADARHPDPVPRPRPLRRRRRGLRRRRHACAGPGRRRTDRDRLRGRGRHGGNRDGARRRHAAGLAGARLQPRLPTSSAIQGRPRRPSPARHVTRIEFVNNRLVCNYMEPRAAIGEWKEDEHRFRPDHRHAGRALGAEDRLRRVRHAGLAKSCAWSRPTSAAVSAQNPSSIASIRWSRGGVASEAAGEMDRRPHRAFPDRRAGPRQRRPPRWRWTARAGSWRCACGSPPTWAPTSRSSRPSSPMSAPPCRPASTTSGRSMSPSPASTPTPARSTPIAAPGGRRRRSCWRSWSTPAPATSASASRRSAAATSSVRSSSPTARRPAASTTSASSTAT
jgi:hypothetical protein